MLVYEQESDEEVLDLNGEDVVMSSSSESDNEQLYAESINDPSFLIPDDELFRGNYNQAHFRQALKQDYKPFQFKADQLPDKPQLADFFNLYQIQLLVPLSDLKQHHSEHSNAKKVFLKDRDNFINFLLFVHGSRLSINTMLRQFTQDHPQCSKYSFDKKLRANCTPPSLPHF